MVIDKAKRNTGQALVWGSMDHLENQQVVSPTHRPPLTQETTPYFCFRLSRSQAHKASARIKIVAQYLNQMHHLVSQYVKIVGCYRRHCCVSHCFGFIFCSSLFYTKRFVTTEKYNNFNPYPAKVENMVSS